MKKKCRICGSEDTKVIFYAAPQAKTKESDFSPTGFGFGIFYDLAKCNSCKSVFALAQEQAVRPERLYSESRDDLYLTQAAERTITFKKVVSWLKGFVPDNGCLLDVGSSFGLFLKLASQTWRETYGVELNREACRYAGEILGLNVFCADLADADFPEGYFDVITAIDFIEHLPDFGGFLRKINKILKAGGILYLVTPDSTSLSAKLFRYRWWSYRTMHLNYFSRISLCGLLIRNGFSIIHGEPFKKTFRAKYLLNNLYESGCAKAFYNFLRPLSLALKFENLIVTASFGDMALTARKL